MKPRSLLISLVLFVFVLLRADELRRRLRAKSGVGFQ